MTTKFLGDDALGPAIVDLLKGGLIRCAVAFWGTGAVKKLFAGLTVPTDAKIVCDISVGSTNPRELTGLGAPRNRLLRHVHRLHAKVYISDLGAIVCSANASDNGIGFVDLAGLVEAGVYLPPNSNAYEDICAWFDQLHGKANALNGKALKDAREAWKRRPRGRGRNTSASKLGPVSLLKTVADDPERFRGIGFAFTTGTAAQKDVVEAAAAVKRRDTARPIQRPPSHLSKALDNWSKGDLFTEWSKQEVDAWPGSFVCIHRSGKNLSYWFYERAEKVMLSDDRGVVFGDRLPGLRQKLGFKHGKDAMMETDASLLRRIFRHCENTGHWLCENGDRLIELIAEVDGD